jgi:hypothetical protein
MSAFTVFTVRIRQRKTAMIGITRRLATGVMVTGLAIAIIATLAMAQSDDPPPRPAWVNQDNSVDLSKLPDALPVVGPDGNILGHTDGSPVTVDLRPVGQAGAEQDGNILSDSDEQDGTEEPVQRITSPDGTEYLVVTPVRPYP